VNFGLKSDSLSLDSRVGQ